MRVNGPYYDERTATWYLKEFHHAGPGGSRRLPYPTEQAAKDGLTRIRQKLARPEETTVEAALTEWIAERTPKVKHPRQLEVLLSDLLAPDFKRPIGRLTPERAEALYDRLVNLPVRRGGRGGALQPRSAAYHQRALSVAREWGAWLVRKKLIGACPFADVEPQGRPKRGAESKVWLDPVQIERFGDAAAEAIRAGELGDGGIAAYLIYALALRASEPGTMHAYQKGDPPKARFILKGTARQRSRFAVRHLPAWLGPILEPRAEAGQPLIRAGRVTVRKAVIQLCQRAGVPVTCPHGLRESIIDYQAAEAAADGELDARLMQRMANRHGHTPAVMARHYMQAGRLEDAAATRRLRVIEGGKGAEGCSPDVPREGMESDSPTGDRVSIN